MDRRQRQRQMRREFAWYGAGFCLIQFGLAVAVEFCWPAVRDPDYANVQRIVSERRTEAPGRPLILALGSSRTQDALCAAQLWRPADPNCPMVVNASVRGGGPMIHLIMLQRLLAAQLRPRIVYLEVIPLSLSAADGAALEQIKGAHVRRYAAAEATQLWRYYAKPSELAEPWLVSRLVPSWRFRVGLRLNLRLDTIATDRRDLFGRDEFGWCAHPPVPADEVERGTLKALHEYRCSLTEPAVAPGAVQAVRDLVSLCAAERIPIVLIVPPEGRAFRSFAPAAAAAQMSAVQDLAREMSVPLIDARAWVDDSYFYDGHHVTCDGAVQFTERFAHALNAMWPPRRTPGSHPAPPAPWAALPRGAPSRSD